MTTKDKAKPEVRYVLTLTDDQARMVETACELYARLKIGQFEQISELMLDVKDVEQYCQRRDIANDLLRTVACVIFGRNINGWPHVQKDALHHRAWNIYHALRYKRAWYENPKGGWGVNYDKPYPYGGEPIPEVEIRKIRTEAMNK